MTPAKHPGFLSFGSVSLYTLISPSSPYFIFDLVLRSRWQESPFKDGSRLFISSKDNKEMLN